MLQELKFGLYEWIPDGRPGGGRHMKKGSEVTIPRQPQRRGRAAMRRSHNFDLQNSAGQQ